MKNILFIFIFFVFSNTIYAQTDTIKLEYLGILKLTEKYQKDANWTSLEEQIVGEHFVRLQKLTAQGKVILSGRVQLPSDDPKMFGLIILKVNSLQDAEIIMSQDPAVINNIMTFEILPFAIATQFN